MWLCFNTPKADPLSCVTSPIKREIIKIVVPSILNVLAYNDFPLRAFVTIIYLTSTEVLLNLVAPLDSAVPSLYFEQNLFFELPVLIPILFYLIPSVSAEGSLNCISRIWFRCSLFWPWVNRYMVHGFDSSVSGYDLLSFSRSGKAKNTSCEL